MIDKEKKENGIVNLVFSREDIVRICGWKKGSKEWSWSLAYIGADLRNLSKNRNYNVKIMTRTKENRIYIIDKEDEGVMA